MNSYFVNPASYCYRGTAMVDRTSGPHCFPSPADQLHPGSVDYAPPPQLLRAHYDEIYGGYGAGYGGYSTSASDKAGTQPNGIGGYYSDLQEPTGHHLGSYSTSGGAQQLPLIDATSGIAFQSRNSAQSPLPAPIDFCRPYMPSGGSGDGVGYQPTAPSGKQTGSRSDGSSHLVSPFADEHPIATTQSKPDQGAAISVSGLGGRRRHVESGRSDCSRSVSGSSSRSSSPGGDAATTGDCRSMEVDSGSATPETVTSVSAGSTSHSAANNRSGSTTTTTSSYEFQQQIYPWMRRIHLANGMLTSQPVCTAISQVVS